MANRIQQYATEIWQDYDLQNGPEIVKIMQTQLELMDTVKEPVGLGTDPAKTILANINLNTAASMLVCNGTLNIAYALQGLVETICKKLSRNCSFVMGCTHYNISILATFDFGIEHHNFELRFPIYPQSKEQLLSWYMDPLSALLDKEFTFVMTYATTGYRSQPEQFIDFKDLYKAIKRRLV